MQTTRRSMSSDVPLRSTNSSTACQQASMRPLSGYEQIGCNSATPRLRCCGAHHNGVSICCQLLSFVLLNCQFCQSDRFATSALISTLTWVCGRTSSQPSELASPLSVRFVASDVHCQDMPCSRWFMHSCWARWITATRSLPEWPEIFSTGCSPF